ncbi:hypothetical protein B0O80DRAFT_452562 [Mortierella sp. GBAus27b]|nr:hypothetical protein B0O80DRAFT_452562 [Mortierella sp. GBAus27b]
MAKVESCFHLNHIPPMDTNNNTLKKEKPVIKEGIDDHSTINIIDLTQEEDPEADKGNKEQPSMPGGIANLTPAVLDEESQEDESPRGGNTVQAKGKVVIRNQILLSPPPSSSFHQSHNILPPSLQREGKQQEVHHVQAAGPRVTMRIDTQLLGSWKYELQALFQFMGEVLYENGQWVLQARTYRNMDGLNLYAFRQSILMTRKLMEQYQQRKQKPEQASGSKIE